MVYLFLTIGLVIGIVFGVLIAVANRKNKIIGTLEVAFSDEAAPYLFLSLDEPIDYISRQTRVTVRVAKITIPIMEPKTKGEKQ